MFFDHWSDIIRVLVVGTLAYVALVVMLRLSGNRTLAKLNAFDFIVTIALGSTLATVLLTKDVALVEGLLAFALLIGLQWVVAWLSARSESVRGIVKGEPRLLVFRGAMLRRAMREERISPDDIHAAARASGFGSLQELEAVVLESDGTISVIQSASSGEDKSALDGVQGYPSGSEGAATGQTGESD